MIPNYGQIRYEVSEQIATITLDRSAKLNAFTSQMTYEVLDALERADIDDEVRCVIFTGAGRAFCAGADLAAGRDSFNFEGEDWRDGGGWISLRIFASKKPVIAAINGPAVGIGATMTLPMDIRLASQDARIGFVFTQRGLVPESCSSWFLPRLVGISQAQEWVLSGDVFPASEALTAGLVREVVPAAELLERARAVARKLIANTSPVAVALARQMLWRMLGANHPMQAHLLDSRALFLMGKSPDAMEGVSAFLEKRPPRFPMKPSIDMPSIEWPDPEDSSLK
jgi:enoyl-CoA hydratase/carnithine racemase